MNNTNGLTPADIRDHHIIPRFYGGESLWCPELMCYLTVIMVNDGMLTVRGRNLDHATIALVARSRDRNVRLRLLPWFSHPMPYRTLEALINDKVLVVTVGADDE